MNYLVEVLIPSIDFRRNWTFQDKHVVCVDSEGVKCTVARDEFDNNFLALKTANPFYRIDGDVRVDSRLMAVITMTLLVLVLIITMAAAAINKDIRQEVTNLRQQAVEFGYAEYKPIDEKTNQFKWIKK